MVASEICAPLISQTELRISLAPFRRSRPHIRADVLSLTLYMSVAPKKVAPVGRDCQPEAIGTEEADQKLGNDACL